MQGVTDGFLKQIWRKFLLKHEKIRVDIYWLFWHVIFRCVINYHVNKYLSSFKPSCLNHYLGKLSKHKHFINFNFASRLKYHSIIMNLENKTRISTRIIKCVNMLCLLELKINLHNLSDLSNYTVQYNSFSKFIK